MSVSTRRIQAMMRGLAVLAVFLGVIGCSESSAGVTVEYQYPCGPLFSGFDGGQQRHFLEWTPDGSQVVFNYAPQGEQDRHGYVRGRAIWVADSNGSEARMLVDANPGHVGLFSFHADVSPDGTRVVYATCEFPTESIRMESFDSERRQLHYEIAVINLNGSGQQRLTANEHLDHFPVWSPDGNAIAFISNPHQISFDNTATAELYAMAADGSDVRLVVSTLNKVSTETEGYFYWQSNAFNTQRDVSEIGNPDEPWLRAVTLAAPAWSPDGEHLAFLVNEGKSMPFQRLLYTMRADGTELTKIGEAANVLIETSRGTYVSPTVPSWAPSGEHLAFAGVNEVGEPSGVYTVRYDGTGLEQVLEPQGPDWFVWHVSWSPDGSEILVVSNHGTYVIKTDGSGFRSLDLSTGTDPTIGIVAAWSPDSTRIAIYIPGVLVPGVGYLNVPPQLFTISRDGTDRRDLITLDADGNLAPANQPQEAP